jgi:hypothetical protein
MFVYPGGRKMAVEDQGGGNGYRHGWRRHTHSRPPAGGCPYDSQHMPQRTCGRSLRSIPAMRETLDTPELAVIGCGARRRTGEAGSLWLRRDRRGGAPYSSTGASSDKPLNLRRALRNTVSSWSVIGPMRLNFSSSSSWRRPGGPDRRTLSRSFCSQYASPVRLQRGHRKRKQM